MELAWEGEDDPNLLDVHFCLTRAQWDNITPMELRIIVAEAICKALDRKEVSWLA